MKNILISVVLCLYSLSLMGQNSTSNSEQQSKIVIQSEPTFEVRLDSTTREEYEDRYGKLIKDKHIYTYDANGNLALTSAFQWHDGLLFVDSENYHFYDSKGNMIEDYNCVKFLDGGIFFHTEYKYYDVEGNVSETVSYDEEEEKIPKHKAEYTYNSEGKETGFADYYWNEEKLEWENNTKEEIIRDKNGKRKQTLNYRWDRYNHNWKKEGKHDIQSTENNKSAVIYYAWREDRDIYKQKNGHIVDSQAGKWEKSSKREAIYDAQGKTVEQLNYNWHKKSQQWQPESKVERHYDESYDGSYELLSPIPKAKNKLASIVIHKWDKEHSTWKLKSKATFHYSKRAVDLESANQSPITVYPNPAEDFVTFDIENINESIHIKLYDIQGKTITSHQLSNDKQLSISHLNSGTYLYQLNYNNQIHTGKIIVK